MPPTCLGDETGENDDSDGRRQPPAVAAQRALRNRGSRDTARSRDARAIRGEGAHPRVGRGARVPDSMDMSPILRRPATPSSSDSGS